MGGAQLDGKNILPLKSVNWYLSEVAVYQLKEKSFIWELNPCPGTKAIMLEIFYILKFNNKVDGNYSIYFFYIIFFSLKELMIYSKMNIQNCSNTYHHLQVYQS